MAYRDELDALRSREALLERDLSDVRARRQELVVLGARAAVLEAELATLARRSRGERCLSSIAFMSRRRARRAGTTCAATRASATATLAASASTI
jgi:hypothetical protein